MHVQINRDWHRIIRVPADVYTEDGDEVDLDDLVNVWLGFATPGESPGSWDSATTEDGRIRLSHGPTGDVQKDAGFYDLWARVEQSGGDEATALVASVEVT